MYDEFWHLQCLLQFLWEYLEFAVFFLLFYLFDWKLVDLMFFSFYKTKCAHPKYRARVRGFVCLSASDCHLAHNLFRPVSHHVRIFFERMTRLFKVSSLFLLQLQSSRTVMTFVVYGIVLLSVCNACKMSWINGKLHLVLDPKWFWFASKDFSTLSQWSVLFVGKEKLQKWKGHLIRVSFYLLKIGYRTITLNRKRALSNKHKLYSKMK